MSQFFVGQVAGGGGTITNVTASDSTVNNSQRIQVTTIGTVRDVELTNHLYGVAGTVNASVVAAVSFVLDVNPAAYIMDCDVIGVETFGVGAAVYRIFAGFKTNGAIASKVGTQINNIMVDAPFAAAAVIWSVAGNTITLSVTGVAGFSMSWTANIFYSKAP